MNRSEVLQYAADSYGTEPEYPWADSPDAAVLRHSAQGRWYALIMSVARRKLGLDTDGETDVINVKCDPLLVDALAGMPGFCRAYHMNKTHWLTVMLEYAPEKAQVFWLIDGSYRLTSDMPQRRKSSSK